MTFWTHRANVCALILCKLSGLAIGALRKACSLGVASGLAFHTLLALVCRMSASWACLTIRKVIVAYIRDDEARIADWGPRSLDGRLDDRGDSAPVAHMRHESKHGDHDAYCKRRPWCILCGNSVDHDAQAFKHTICIFAGEPHRHCNGREKLTQILQDRFLRLIRCCRRVGHRRRVDRKRFGGHELRIRRRTADSAGCDGWNRDGWARRRWWRAQRHWLAQRLWR